MSGTASSTISYTLNGNPGTATLNAAGNGNISISSPTANQILLLTSVNDGTCSQSITGNSTLTVTPTRTPTFTTWGPYCKDDITPTVTLPATSTDGISGTWAPASVSTASVGTVVHTLSLIHI